MPISFQCGRQLANPEPLYSPGTNKPAATDRDGICLAQVRTGAGALTLAGAGVSGGVYSAGFDGGRKITAYSAGDIHTVTFTVTGTDKDGTVITEDLTNVNNSTITGAKYFQTVTGVASSATIGTNVEIGFAASLIVLNMGRASVFKIAPANGETVLVAMYGADNTGAAYAASLHLVTPASLTLTWADGTTPTDTRVYFAGGTEPTLTASGDDWFTFICDGTTASSDTVWYGFTSGQDLKA